MSNSYAALAAYYDAIMTSGYYDYDAYARALLDHIGEGRDVLELGVGTGLVCEHLLAMSPAGLRITGLDHTESMLDRARARLGDRVHLVQRDILDEEPLPALFDAAYSVGGVWYGVHDGHDTWLGSHLTEDDDNLRALANVTRALRPSGTLLLAVQEPHRAYTRPLPDGLRYAQKVDDHGGGRFTKDYRVLKDERVLAHQRSPFRLQPRSQADALFRRCGLRRADDGAGRFLRYVRV
ncbi:class I SAM-dependent methyltransferase [Streptomyces sp. NPDC001705]|uniref:class I SAM-dependent methyltransferase n=1 Tax=Streptomyces sp. NPDC046988 TaxID=3154922 RepID=UPI0033CBC7DE